MRTMRLSFSNIRAYMNASFLPEGVAVETSEGSLPGAGPRQGPRHARAACRRRRRSDPGRDRQAARPQPQRALPHARHPGPARLCRPHRRRPLRADPQALRAGAAPRPGAPPGLLRDPADARACRDLASGQPARRLRSRFGGGHRPAGGAELLGHLDPRRLACQPARHRLGPCPPRLPPPGRAPDDARRARQGPGRAGRRSGILRPSSTRSAPAATR